MRSDKNISKIIYLSLFTTPLPIIFTITDRVIEEGNCSPLIMSKKRIQEIILTDHLFVTISSPKLAGFGIQI